MAQQQRPRSPGRLAEAKQQAARRLRVHRIGLVDEGHHDLDEIGFLANLRIGRVIGKPGHVRECRRDEDRLLPVGQIVLLNFHQPVAVAIAVAVLDRQDINHWVAPRGIELFGRSTRMRRRASLVRRRHLVRQKTVPVGRRGRNVNWFVRDDKPTSEQCDRQQERAIGAWHFHFFRPVLPRSLARSIF